MASGPSEISMSDRSAAMKQRMNKRFEVDQRAMLIGARSGARSQPTGNGGV